MWSISGARWRIWFSPTKSEPSGNGVTGPFSNRSKTFRTDLLYRLDKDPKNEDNKEYLVRSHSMEIKNTGQRSFRVIKAYRSAFPDPLVVKKGERLSILPRDTEWPGWIWCVHDSGKSGWVPENWTEKTGPACMMLRDYNATELTVRPGESISGFLESGWVCGECPDGRKGWVPLECLEEVP
jgi:hypothetical protein